MLKKEWIKPRVKELDVLRTEVLFGDLTTAAGLYLLLKDGDESKSIFS